jgi:hypothetical protein
MTGVVRSHGRPSEVILSISVDLRFVKAEA